MPRYVNGIDVDTGAPLIKVTKFTREEPPTEPPPDPQPPPPPSPAPEKGEP